MKQRTTKKATESVPEMRAEYDFSKAAPNKYAARYAQTPRWFAAAPLPELRDWHGVFSEPQDIGFGVFIGRLPSWLQEHRIWQADDVKAHAEAFFDSGLYLMTEVDETSINGDSQQHRTQEQIANWVLQSAALAVWLARPCPVGYRELIIFRKDALTRPQSTSNGWVFDAYQVGGLSLRHAAEETDCAPNARDLNLIRDLHLRLRMHVKQGAARTAGRTLFQAVRQEEWEVRYLMLWIVLEALFGPEDGREMTFRLAQRIALFLKKTAAERRELRSKVKKAYELRSKVVHGARHDKLTPRDSAIHTAIVEDIIRSAMQKILLDEDLLTTFSADQREEFLDDLAIDEKTLRRGKAA